MPTAIAYRRAPLVDPALVPLSDAAVHADGLQKQLTDLALGLVDLNRMSPLDAALATKLGGYTETPPFPDVEAAAGLLPNEPERFAALLRAASMLASMERDKQAMLRVLGGMRAFLDALGELNEERLFACGADILRLAVDLYRRTGPAVFAEPDGEPAFPSAGCERSDAYVSLSAGVPPRDRRAYAG